MTDVRGKLRSLVWLAFALAALVNAGCLVAALGVAGAGAAAAGYTYYNGLLYRDYSANIADSLMAVRAALVELHFPILEEKTDTGSAFVRTRSADGHTIRVYLDVVSSPIPIEGALTRVGVRVGYIGDDAVSARILDQVSRHLAPRPAAAIAAPAVNPGSIRPVSASVVQTEAALPGRPVPVVETVAPPLAPAAGGSASPR